MNTKGVEDGITETAWIDPRTNEACRRCDGTGKMPPWPGSKGLVACGVCRETQTAAVPVANLDELLRNVRSATPEELTAQAESYGKSYKPGPTQATPFMPTLPVPERTKILMEALRAVENERLDEIYVHGEDAAYSRAIHDAEDAIKALIEGKPK